MFVGCEKLRGGAQTTYSASHNDVDYARIDGGSDSPGYLTYGPAPDGIKSIPFASTLIRKEGIYDLQGRRTKSLPKGIYIIHGRKVLIQ